MRSAWRALRHKFSEFVHTRRALDAFRELQNEHPDFRAFGSPEDVVQFLTGSSTDLDGKDAVLRRMVQLAQAEQSTELAAALLWLSLAPGLDGIYGRRLRLFLPAEGELTSCIAEAFLALVRSIHLERNTRIAAALVRGTERTVLDAYRRTVLNPSVVPTADLEATRVEALAEPSLAEEVEALSLWLRPLIGADADLLVLVLVVGENQREAGVRLGLSHEAARKRYRRALVALRKIITKHPSQFDLPRARLSFASSRTESNAPRSSTRKPEHACESIAVP